MALTLKEALAILEQGNWVSLRLLTAHVAKGTGGKVLELAKCRIARRQPEPGATGSKSASSHPEKKRDANHRLNFTRNVETQRRDIITIHPILITHINQQPVL
jgi:uncharacterized protein YciW